MQHAQTVRPTERVGDRPAVPTNGPVSPVNSRQRAISKAATLLTPLVSAPRTTQPAAVSVHRASCSHAMRVACRRGSECWHRAVPHGSQGPRGYLNQSHSQSLFLGHPSRVSGAHSHT